MSERFVDHTDPADVSVEFGSQASEDLLLGDDYPHASLEEIHIPAYSQAEETVAAKEKPEVVVFLSWN